MGNVTPIGVSRIHNEIIRRLDCVVSVPKIEIMLCGPSGAGKGVYAQYLYHASKAQPNAFVIVNCGSIPEPLFENELFGHVRGAFTGAEQRPYDSVVERARTAPCFSTRSTRCPWATR